MSPTLLALAGLALSSPVLAAANEVVVVEDEQGWKLQVDGEDYFVRGMNWGYIPIGENYSYDFWGKPDAFIEKALREEMSLLKRMGVNSIRQFPGIPPRWVTWIYREYGITTMMNPHFGRYGLTIDGAWVPTTDYSDPRTREVILEEVREVVETYKDTEGILLFLLGNENNYGLSWSSFEIEALPKGERDTARATHLYTLFGEGVDLIHELDDQHPVAIANGDLQYLDLIVEHVPNLDIMGSNVYRGSSSGDLFARVKDELGVPFLYTEFGADAYDAARGQEDGLTQSRYLHAQWREIYEKTHGKGLEGNAIGGYTFQWSDGWWKYLQEENLDVHDTNASWPNGAYREDYVEGSNNMNEEWFGICAKGPTRPDGTFPLFPRESFFVLKEAYELDPYADGVDLADIRAHFGAIEPADYTGQAQAGTLSARVQEMSRAMVTDVRLELSTIASQRVDDDGREIEAIDHTESFWLGFQARPTQDVSADLRLNVLGNVAENRIDRLFWEAAATDRFVLDEEGEPVDVGPLDRVRVHDAGFSWNHELFEMTGYYRQGHYHWAHEGDFFGLYREAFYGPNPDIYQANVPIGVEIAGKKGLDGLKMALGPQIYWGANPSVMAKYREGVGPVTVTAVHLEELASRGVDVANRAISEPMSRRSTLTVETGQDGNGLTLGGIWGGSNKIGWEYRKVQEARTAGSLGDSGYDLLEDEIRPLDTLGFRAKLAGRLGKVSAYVQGGVQGLVADGGGDPTVTFVGWNLKQSGRGNQRSVLGGAMLPLGNVQIAPSVLWQQPLEGPLPAIDATLDPTTGAYTPAVQGRNVVDDPFAVRENRETTAFELLLIWDPTPGSWMWSWDNFVREDAGFSAALDAVYRIQPTTTDAHIGFLADGTAFSFGTAPPPQDLVDVSGHVHLRPRGDVRLRVTGYGGTGQSTGSDPRLVTRYGATAVGWYRTLALEGTVKFDDWGPYDYHRDFNLTFPFQGILDLSGSWLAPRLDGSQPRVGVRGQYRTFDEHSPAALLLADPGQASEWEIGTYAFIGI